MLSTNQISAEKSSQPPIYLGCWNYYFIAKLVLFWRELIDFHPLENLGFAAFLLAPVASPFWRRLRLIASIPMGLALLYHDSWLPPISRLFSQASLLSHFSFAYMLELLGRFISLPVLALLVISWVVFRFVALRLRVGVLVVACLLVMVFSPLEKERVAAASPQLATPAKVPEGNDLDSVLRDFYQRESARRVAFSKPDNDVPFDVIFLHVCSLSWDDLQMLGLDQHPLWKRFDILFTQFNSAASYSGPAAIRFLRGSCGQSPHESLYSSVPEQCYLFDNLVKSGFEPQLLLNHDGHFDDFLGLIKQRGGLPVVPMSTSGLPIFQRSFDDSAIFDDKATLARWVEQRAKNPAARVAAYYNTISLHDGNYLVSRGRWSSSIDTYRERLTRLLDDIEVFLQQLERGGRRAVVAVVPEHGAALRGDRTQISGLREIPSPSITLVPVGLKIIGPDARRQGDQQKIDQPTSYLALSHLIAGTFEKSPFGDSGFLISDYTKNLPTTEFVAENEDMRILQRDGQYHLRQGKGGWAAYVK